MSKSLVSGSLLYICRRNMWQVVVNDIGESVMDEHIIAPSDKMMYNAYGYI